MVKKKATDKGPAEVVGLDDVMDAVVGRMREEMGESKVLVGGRADAKHVGLYIPHLALRYLFQINVLPLGGRMMQITGKQMSSKSSFLYWLYRLFRNNNGKSHHIDVETKDSEPLRMSFLEYDERAVQPYSADSLEDWQKILMYIVDPKRGIKGQLEKAGYADRYPMIMGVDSFMAKATTEIQNKIMKDGYAGRDHPIEAMSVSKFLKSMPHHFKDVPWLLVGTNHLKPSQDFMGRPVDNIGGGMSLKFQETFEVKMARVSKFQLASYEGNRIALNTAKNSVGPWDKEIETDMLWYTDRATGRQVTWWDWDAASVELILGKNCKRDVLNKQVERRRELVDATGIREAAAGKAFSTVLDVPQSEALPYDELGKLLEKRPDVLKEVHLILGIQEHVVFQSGTSFRETAKKARESTGVAPDSYVSKALQNDEDTQE